MGNLILAVAENRLSCDLLGKRLHQIDELPSNIYGYPPGRGFPRLREAIAAYMRDTFLQVMSCNCQKQCDDAGPFHSKGSGSNDCGGFSVDGSAVSSFSGTL